MAAGGWLVSALSIDGWVPRASMPPVGAWCVAKAGAEAGSDPPVVADPLAAVDPPVVADPLAAVDPPVVTDLLVAADPAAVGAPAAVVERAAAGDPADIRGATRGRIGATSASAAERAAATQVTGA